MTPRKVAPRVLADVATRVLDRLGVSAVDAELVARQLVWADVHGISTHGISRLPSYCEAIERGTVNPRPVISIEHRRAAIAIVDGDRGPGPVALHHGRTAVHEIARQAGVGWVAVVDCGHTGALGYAARSLAAEGLAAIVFGASRPTMAYHGARTAGVATNPLAIAVPGRTGPVALDMATSTASRGLLHRHRATGRPLAADWALDDEGRPTTDPAAAVTLTPVAGPKGSGMSLMFELLAAVLPGVPLVAPKLAGTERGPKQAATLIAVDVAAVTEVDRFLDDVEELRTQIKGLPRVDGVDELLLPGERSARTARRHEADGIELDEHTHRELSDLLERLELEPLERSGDEEEPVTEGRP